MKKLIRKTWPKVRLVRIKEQTFYRVDARRSGTKGRQETFKSQKEAEKRATEIATQFGTNGKEGLSFPAELRGMALAADRMLRPYSRTLLQAAEFYKAHLDTDQQRKDSALVSVLAQAWYKSKEGGKSKRLFQRQLFRHVHQGRWIYLPAGEVMGHGWGSGWDAGCPCLNINEVVRYLRISLALFL